MVHHIPWDPHLKVGALGLQMILWKMSFPFRKLLNDQRVTGTYPIADDFPPKPSLLSGSSDIFIRSPVRNLGNFPMVFPFSKSRNLAEKLDPLERVLDFDHSISSQRHGRASSDISNMTSRRQAPDPTNLMRSAIYPEIGSAVFLKDT